MTGYKMSNYKPWSQQRRKQGYSRPHGQHIQVLKFNDFQPDPELRIKIENYRYLASYNWTKDNEPTILVPGAPPIWRERTLPYTIPKDDGNARIAANAERIVAPSFSPFFAALWTMLPSYSLTSIDLVTDRNSLRKLFAVASGRSSDFRGFTFRMNVEVIGNTMFLTRVEDNQNLVIAGSFMSGYGHAFEEAFLEFGDGLEESVSHHRIVEYDIGGMKWVVRYEADGSFADDSLPNNLETDMVNLSLASKCGTETVEGVEVFRKGKLVPPESIIELKCSGGNRSGLGDKLSQCWFSQTPYLFQGRHKDGTVNEINQKNISDNLKDWDERNQKVLKKLVHVIAEIKEAAKSGRCCIVFSKAKPGVLEVFASQDNGLQLTAEAKERYWRPNFE